MKAKSPPDKEADMDDRTNGTVEQAQTEDFEDLRLTITQEGLDFLDALERKRGKRFDWERMSKWETFKDFLSYPREALVKPADWSEWGLVRRSAWKSARRWFVVQLAAVALSLAALLVAVLRS